MFEDQIEFIVDQYLAGTAPVGGDMVPQLVPHLVLGGAVYSSCTAGTQPGRQVEAQLFNYSESHALDEALAPSFPTTRHFTSPYAALHHALYRPPHPLYCSAFFQEVEETKEEAAAREREAREAEQRSEFEQIQEGRRLLPMFPYR